MKTLSVAIICQDEAQTLPYTLYCIWRTLMPCLADVIIVDGGSEDNTVDVIEAWMEKLPIVLIHHAYDTAGRQKNRALERCSGEHVLSLDADMTFGINLATMYASGYFNSHPIWDFLLYFTVGNEYHHCPKNGKLGGSIGKTTRLFLANRRYLHDFHEQVYNNGERSLIGFCKEVPFFENSWLQTRSAMLHRGARWQKYAAALLARGIGPGPPNRYERNEFHARHIYVPLPPNVANNVVPRNEVPFLVSLDKYREAEWHKGTSVPPPLKLWDTGYGF